MGWVHFSALGSGFGLWDFTWVGSRVNEFWFGFIPLFFSFFSQFALILATSMEKYFLQLVKKFLWVTRVHKKIPGVGFDPTHPYKEHSYEYREHNETSCVLHLMGPVVSRNHCTENLNIWWEMVLGKMIDKNVGLVHFLRVMCIKPFCQHFSQVTCRVKVYFENWNTLWMWSWF